MREQELATLLHNDSEPAPPSRVDLDRVRLDGSRRIRRRRATITGLAAVAATAAIVSGMAVAGARNSAPPVTTEPAASAPSATVTTPPVDSRGFNPLRRRFVADWAPDGLTYRSENSTSRFYSLDLSSSDPRQPDEKDRSVGLLVFPAGTALPGQFPKPTGDGPLWAGSTLIWRWTTDGWAVLTVSGNFAGPARQVADRFVAGLRTDADEPVLSPFWLPVPPDPFRLLGVTTANRPEGRFEAELRFGDAPDAEEWLTVRASHESGLLPLRASTTINGRPALVASGDESRYAAISRADGYRITVLDRTGLLTEAQAVQLATEVELRTDRSQWTNKPLFRR